MLKQYLKYEQYLNYTLQWLQTNQQSDAPWSEVHQRIPECVKYDLYRLRHGYKNHDIRESLLLTISQMIYADYIKDEKKEKFFAVAFHCPRCRRFLIQVVTVDVAVCYFLNYFL